MNYRRSIYYFIALFIILLIAYAYSRTYLIYLRAWPEPGQGLMCSLSLFSIKHFGAMIFTIFMGMLLGIEAFIKNLKQKGKWSIDIKRLLIITLPCLLLSIEYFRFVLLNDITHIGTFHLIAPAQEPFFRFIAGFTIITSFYKKPEIIKEN